MGTNPREQRGGRSRAEAEIAPPRRRGTGSWIEHHASHVVPRPAMVDVSGDDGSTMNGPAEMRNPKVSVLIPNYNYAGYLPETIDSVLEQDFDDYELLVIDDASTDESADVIRGYGVRDARIRFRINETNRGMVQNLNDCLEWARGEYVKFLLADDRMVGGGALGKLVQIMDDHPSVRLVWSARQLIDEHSRAIKVRNYGPRSRIEPGIDLMLECLGNSRNVIGEPSAVMFRRADAADGFDPSYLHLVDLEMWLRLLEGGDFAYTPERLSAFRKHSRQQSEVIRGEGRYQPEYVRLLEKYLDSIVETGRRDILFRMTYQLRKLGHRDPGTQAMLRKLDDAWAGRKLLFYTLYARYKIARPFENLSWALSARLHPDGLPTPPLRRS